MWFIIGQEKLTHMVGDGWLSENWVPVVSQGMEIHYPNELFDAVSCRKKYLNPAQNKFRDRKGKNNDT